MSPRTSRKSSAARVGGGPGGAARVAQGITAAVDSWRRLPPGTPGIPTGHWQFLGLKTGESFKPFAAQMEILNSVRVPWPGLCPDGQPYPLIWGINCGRRFGKTTIGGLILWAGVLAPDDFFGPPAVRLTADTDEHAQKIWRPFIHQCEATPLKALVKDHSREYNRVEFHTGATVQMLSGHNPQALSGDGVTLWVIDEAQFITQAAYDNLLPSTAERNGVIVMLGVSEGDGPFREVSFRGDSGDYPEFKRLAYPSAANPFVPRWMIDFHSRTMAPTKFKQLYLAQWVDELGKVLRNVEGCINNEPISVHPTGFGYTSPAARGHAYFGGLDLGRLTDWTVYSVWDREGKLVAWDRFSLVEWELQKHRVAQLSALYGHPQTVVDSTGIGDPIFLDLARLGMSVQEYKITSNDSKRILVDELAIRVGAGNISYPRIPTLIEEFTRFEAKRSNTPGSNVVRYEAPAGQHDDFVMSCALAMQIVPAPTIARVRSELRTNPNASVFDGFWVDHTTGDIHEGVPPTHPQFHERSAFEYI